MESITMLLSLLLLVAAATVVIACLAVYNRKGRQRTRPPIVEETQPTVVEEEQLPATQEPQPTVAEETQPTPAEGAQPAVAQEAQQTGGEETQPQAMEEAQPAEETQPTAGSKQEPVKRGGRSRGRTEALEKQSAPEAKPRRPKPEIICWQSERQWIPAVEVPEGLYKSPAVSQNGHPLIQDESREGCWRLEEAYGQVVVQWDEDEIAGEVKIALGEESYLLFKLSGQDQKRGCRVKSPSSGSYLMMVPESWERDEALSGPPPVTPEPVFLIGYQAHFFELERGGNEKIAFRTPEGKSVVLETKASRFELVGTCLNDAAEGIGPLFGERPPKIRARDDWTWEGIGTIVVGREGRGKSRCRKSFSPVPEKKAQDLPPEVAVRKDGWYFLRFYDTNGDLVESLDFRFVSALRGIRILQPSPFPSEDEHGSAQVEFRHEPGCVIQPADDPARSIRIESKGDKTTLTIPPEFVYDETQWRIGSEGRPRVQVTILVERLWWAVGQENNPPSGWTDELLTLVCDDFAATSKRALWLRFPRRRWIDSVLAGFERPKARSYVVRVADKEIAIPLREFGDCQEMAERDRDHFLNIWIQRDRELVEGIVAVVPASPILCVGCGRKKVAVARVVLREGAGAIRVNGRPVEDYFAEAPLRARQFLERLLELPDVSQILSQMEVSIRVTGSSPGTVQQVKASAHALARSLMTYDPQLKPLLRREGFGGSRVTKRSGVQ